MKTLQHLIPTITAGLMMGIIELLVLMSFATLIFSGDLGVFVGQGIGIFIITGIVTMTITALFSSITGGFGSVQDASSVLLALIAATIAGKMSNPQSDETYYTVLAAMGINTLLVALLFILITQFKLTNLIRTLPYPVIGGLIAGSGWYLFKGGLEILTNATPVTDYFQEDVLIRWLPALILAIGLFWGLRRFDHYLILPGFLLGSVILFYIILLATGTSIDEAQTDGFLLGPFPEGGLFKLLTPANLGEVDWGVILGAYGHTTAILAVSAVTMILNITGLELVLREDVDIDRELQVAGLANGIAGLFGGGISYQALSLTAIARRIGANNRIYPLISVAVALMVVFIGTDVLVYFPKTVFGGLLVFLGFGFMAEWLGDAYRQLPRLDYGMIVVITLAMATIGYLEGVIIGMVLSVVVFAFDYSRVENVRHHFSGAEYHSTVQRPDNQMEILRSAGDAIEIYQLQGFIFFGTANALYIRMTTLLDPVKFLILDFQKVIKLDSSATYSIQKLSQFCRKCEVELIFSNVPASVEVTLKKIEATRYDQLDLALAYAEEQLLKAEAFEAVPPGTITIVSRLPQTDWAEIFSYMERRTVPKGSLIAKQGTLAEGMYFVSKGMLGVYLNVDDDHAYRIRTIQQGSVVGEIGMYLKSTRTADIIAEVDSEILILSHEGMQGLIENNPTLATQLHEQIARLMAQRLKDTTHALEAALK
jgi:SulP family sulfate permease